MTMTVEMTVYLVCSGMFSKADHFVMFAAILAIANSTSNLRLGGYVKLFKLYLNTVHHLKFIMHFYLLIEKQSVSIKY